MPAPVVADQAPATQPAAPAELAEAAQPQPAAVGAAARGRPPREALAPEAVAALVQRAQAGDAAAFARLYELHVRLVYTYFRYHLNGRTDLADDLTADVFLKALEKLPSYRLSGAPFSAWLYRIAHNHLIDTVRAHKKQPGVPLDACAALADVEDPHAARALEGTLTQAQIAGALSGLTREQRQVIAHRFLHDRSLADTAQRMAKNTDSVKQLQLRALRNLRHALAA